MSLCKQTLFRGTATALITPFRDGKIDYPALGGMIERQIGAGVSALLVAGTTGECATLTVEEHRALVKFTREKIGDRVPLLAGCGSNSTAHALLLSKNACEEGADALLTVTPYYNKASEQGLLLHFRALADAAKKPLILYNVPSRTGCHITMELYRELAEHENIIGVKEASGDLCLLEALVSECGDRLDVYTGNDEQAVAAMKLGAIGVISVLSNILPKETAELTRLCGEGEYRAAGERQRALAPKIKALFREVNPIPVKYAAARMGYCKAEYRLPLCAPSPETQKAIEKAFLREK